MPLRIGGLKSKYFSRHTKVDGIRFDSMAEARRYSELKLLVKAGQITDFERQPLYDLFVPGHGTGEPVKWVLPGGLPVQGRGHGGRGGYQEPADQDLVPTA